MIYNYRVSLTPQRSNGRESIERLERLIAENFDQVDCPVRDHFAPGVYVRDQFIPKGTTLIGMIHKTEHLAVVTKGRIAISDGENPARVFEAGDVIHSLPGVKRAGFALEDARVINIHPTDETDLDKLCEQLVECRPEQLLGGSKNKQLEHQQLRTLSMGDPQ